MLDTQSIIRPSFKFLTVYFLHTPKEHNSYYRPLVASFNDDIERELVNTTTNCTDFTSSALTSVAGKILMPSRTAQGVSAIVNGWDSSRFAFFIEAEVNRGGAVYREAYQGYTDHLGVSGFGNSQHVDPSMRLTINNRSILKVIRGNNLTGTQVLPSKLVNQLANTNIIGLDGWSEMRAKDSMKPDDVLAARSGLLSYHQADHDTRTMITSSTKAADSNDLAANSFLSKTFGAYKKSLDSRESEWDDESTTLANARGFASVMDNSGAAMLSMLHNTVGFDKDSTFTWGELISTFPEVDDKAQFILPTNGVVEDSTMFTEDMGGSNAEANIAFNLGHLMPNVLFQASFGSVEIVITNRNFEGAIKAVCIDANPLYKTNLDFTARRMRMLDRIENELLHLLFDTSTTVFTLKIKSSLINGSIIKIQLDDKERTYRVPNYCTSINSPMISTGTELRNLAEKLQGTFEAIHTNSSSPQLF